MINDFHELKHKCIILPLEEFKDVMDAIYNYTEDEDGTYGFLWTFYNQHFEFKLVHPKLIEMWQDTVHLDTTLEDIADYFMIDNISEIICYTNYQDPPVFIIYD